MQLQLTCVIMIIYMSNVRYLWIDFADIYSTENCSNLQSTVQMNHLFLAAEKIVEFPARRPGDAYIN